MKARIFIVLQPNLDKPAPNRENIFQRIFLLNVQEFHRLGPIAVISLLLQNIIFRRVKWYFVTFVGILVTALLVGCEESPAIAPLLEVVEVLPTASTVSVAVTPEPSATPTVSLEVVEQPATTDVTSLEMLVEYHRSGGFVGFDDYLTIDSNDSHRKATITRQGKYSEFNLDQNDFEQLLQQFEKSKFSTLDKEYLPANTCCDLIEYTITFKGHTVRTMDTAIPEVLQSIRDWLNQLIDAQTKP